MYLAWEGAVRAVGVWAGADGVEGAWVVEVMFSYMYLAAGYVGFFENHDVKRQYGPLYLATCVGLMLFVCIFGSSGLAEVNTVEKYTRSYPLRSI